jgi:hypothetical protein
MSVGGCHGRRVLGRNVHATDDVVLHDVVIPHAELNRIVLDHAVVLNLRAEASGGRDGLDGAQYAQLWRASKRKS